MVSCAVAGVTLFIAAGPAIAQGRRGGEPVTARLPKAPALSETPVLEIKANEIKGKVSPYLYGIMTENINFCYDGGLYAEMICNRNFREMLSGLPRPTPDPSLLEVRRGRGGFVGFGTNAAAGTNALCGARRGGPGTNALAAERRDPPVGRGSRRSDGLAFWDLIQSGGGAGTMEADPSQPLNQACVNSLKLTVTGVGADGKVGVSNEGCWGMSVRPNTPYKATVWAKGGNGFTGPLTLALCSTDGKTVYAEAKIARLTDHYQKYEATTSKADGLGTDFTRTFAPYSANVLILKGE